MLDLPHVDNNVVVILTEASCLQLSIPCYFPKQTKNSNNQVLIILNFEVPFLYFHSDFITVRAISSHQTRHWDSIQLRSFEARSSLSTVHNSTSRTFDCYTARTVSPRWWCFFEILSVTYFYIARRQSHHSIQKKVRKVRRSQKTSHDQRLSEEEMASRTPLATSLFIIWIVWDLHNAKIRSWRSVQHTSTIKQEFTNRVDRLCGNWIMQLIRILSSVSQRVRVVYHIRKEKKKSHTVHDNVF